MRFGNDILLRGYNLSARHTHPAGTVRLVLYWEATGRPLRDYTVFNHIVSPSGAIVGQRDGPPGKGQSPTSRWRPRDLIADVHEIQVKEDAPAGRYELVTGLYELSTLQRLPALQAGGTGSDRFSLGSFSVTEWLP